MLDDLDAADAPFTVPLVGGDATTLKRLANNESTTNIGLMKNGCCSWKNTREKWKTGQTEPK